MNFYFYFLLVVAIELVQYYHQTYLINYCILFCKSHIICHVIGKVHMLTPRERDS